MRFVNVQTLALVSRIALVLVLVAGLMPAVPFAGPIRAWASVDASVAEGHAEDAQLDEDEEARLAEEQRQREEEARLAEEQRQREEEARLAEEQRQREEEAQRQAEEQRQREEEEARLAEEQRQAEEARLAEEQRQREEEAQRQAEELARKQREDQAAADAFVAVVDALPSATQAVGADAEAVNAAYATYDALTPDQKSLVPPASVERLQAIAYAVAAARDAEADGRKGQGSEGGAADGGTGVDSSQGAAPAETYFVKTLLLKWDKPDDMGVTHFVGDSRIVERAYQTVRVVEFGETVQLNGFYLSTDGTGTVYQTADSSTPIGSFELAWRSSDTSVAAVTPDGLVRPQGKNGQVTITATVSDARVYEGAAPAASVTIVFDGQEGKYVKQVEILDEDGNGIGQGWGGVTVYNEENAFHQLHARITWYNVADGSETVQTTGMGQDYDARGVDTTLTWNVSTSSAFTINEDTGRLRCTSYSGNAYVTCSAVGGLGGTVVSDSANVQLDTGTYEYKPADSLQLKVVWEERPDEVVKEATYTYEDLLGLLPSYHANATVVSGSRFGVISADGFLFKDVVGLVAVDDADVLQYRFKTADGYDNPVSYHYLFESGNRYYFPNYELGGSRAGGEIVPPLLSYKSSFEWNRSEANPDAVLDEGTRFRLVFGCLGSGDANTSYQVYYVYGITVVLKGAPPVGDEGGTGADTRPEGKSEGSRAEGDGGKPESPDQGEAESGSAGSAPSDTDASMSGGASAPGRGGSVAGGRGRTAATGTKRSEHRAASGAARAEAGPSAQAEASAEAGAERPTGEGREPSGDRAGEDADADGDEGAAAGQAKRWRVYQMMNKSNSDVPDWDDENPISPFAAPLALGTFAIGVGATGLNFRRRLT